MQQIVTPVQVKRCQELAADRAAKGLANFSLEQALQEEGLLTEDECERLWDQIARAGDTHVRDQLADKLGTRPGDEPAETSASRRADPNYVPRRLGDYEIVEPIGRGGMGMVYKARQIQMERYVALKLLPPDLAKNAKYIRRFIREARAAGSLNHGNLVHVHDVGEAEGRYFISMELVEGRTVKQIMRREGRVGILDTLRMAEQVCAALDCAHKHKIVHRDIKPDNIMVTPLGIAKLCDLGLAKVLEGGALQDTDTQDGHAMGTPHYMSPEQARSSGKVDARSDLYSLGATLYHMLTGRVPFDGETPIEVLMRVTNEAPARPDRFEPLLPPPLTGLVMRLLAKDPNDRPSTAEQVRKEIHQLRRDLESGRVFVFDDLPLGLKVGKPVPAPEKPPEPAWRKWGMGVAAAMAFMGVCAAASRSGSAGGAAPPPEYAAFAPAPRAAPATGTTSVLPRAAEDPKAGRTVPEILALDPASREQIEKRLAADPASWPKVLAALETVSAEELAATQGDEQARWAALKAGALKLRDEDAERVFSRRLAGAEALAQAGQFRRAVALLDELPPHARGSAAVKEKAAAAKAEIGARVLKDIVDRAKGVDERVRAGLPRAAWRECESWAAELEADGLDLKTEVPAPNPRVQAWRAASDAVRQASLREMSDQEAAGKALQQAAASLERVRERSGKHDLAGAKELAERLLRLSNSEPERSALNLEIERLKRVQLLYGQVAKAIADRPGRIKESDFRNNARVSGRVKALEGDHLVVIADPGVVANVPLANLTRAEVRALIGHVMLKEEIVPDDLLGRLAYDLEDRSDSGLRLLLIDLAGKDEGAAALLARLLAWDAPWLRAQARELLARAEDIFVQGRYYEAQRMTAAALSSVGGIGDTAVEKRAQRLLELCSGARMRSDLLRAAAHPQPRERIEAFYAAGDLTARNGDWTWQGAHPGSGEDGALVFGPAAVTAAPVWKLNAPALLEMDAYVPLDAQGSLQLSVAPVDAEPGAAAREGWVLRLDAGQEGIQGTFARQGETPAPWSSTRLTLARHQRLWVRLDVGAIRWGVEDRELGQRDAGAAALWRVELKGEGALHLYGLRVEGRLETGRTQAQRILDGMRALNQALQQDGAARAEALKNLLIDYGAYPSLASRACAELAEYYRDERRGAEIRYWESRALFECPSSAWPDETRALLADHRLWLNARDRLGPTATDALRYGRMDAYHQPSLSIGAPEKKAEDPAQHPEKAPAEKPKDGKLENEEADLNAPRPSRFGIRILSNGKVTLSGGAEPAVGLREPKD
ncbi:MAG: serine/threonine protein kinase [Planctomycetota bacterium]|nr:serine/threonine protein kinase [Planctomycetota bacterium]